MPGFGYWAGIFSGTLMLVGAIALRRHPKTNSERGFWNAMAVLGLGMIVGPFQWALDIGGESTRIAASWVSILLSCTAIALMVRHQLVTRRRGA